MPGVGQDREEGAALRALLRLVLGRIALGVALQALADDAESMHYLVAHALPDLTTALVVPAAAVVCL
ncbi:hypothetical protein [Streptomyces atratus]|uniref:hypothetical protein n=1 Tax=Streptomyces atratus TaxID=1893 RepID=UPI0021A4F67F|nr:hypothetical protein [Streptomyces atratus]MCT2548414.1 hypothetical protein [Streptomyces atratus]